MRLSVVRRGHLALVLFLLEKETAPATWRKLWTISLIVLVFFQERPCLPLDTSQKSVLFRQFWKRRSFQEKTTTRRKCPANLTQTVVCQSDEVQWYKGHICSFGRVFPFNFWSQTVSAHVRRSHSGCHGVLVLSTSKGVSKYLSDILQKPHPKKAAKYGDHWGPQNFSQLLAAVSQIMSPQLLLSFLPLGLLNCQHYLFLKGLERSVGTTILCPEKSKVKE